MVPSVFMPTKETPPKEREPTVKEGYGRQDSEWQGFFGDDSSDLQTVKEESLDPAHWQDCDWQDYDWHDYDWHASDWQTSAKADSSAASSSSSFVQKDSWTSAGRSRGTRGRKRKEVHNMPSMEESIGMDLHASHPKTAVRDFLIRYFGEKIDRDDCYYVLQEDEAGFRAKLHVPIWSSDVFEGQQCDSEKEAERSAAECFLREPQVVEIAANLPAPMKVVKHWEKMNRFSGNQTRHRVGIDDCRRVYNEQREKGCRMAVWDGRA